MTSAFIPGSSLGLSSVPNLRDLGGYRTAGGHVVRRGLVFRSDQLHRLAAGDLAAISALGIRSVVDLRMDEERIARPSELPAGALATTLDVLADSVQAGGDPIGALFTRPAEANAALAGGRVHAVFEEIYRSFVTMPSARRAYRALFETLAVPARLPLLFHCTTGKDRTGWGAAVLLSLLGVARVDVESDYLRSNDYVPSRHQSTMDALVRAGADASIVSAIFAVRREYLAAAFDEVDTRFGSIEGYATEGLGLDARSVDALRAACLGPR